MSVVGVRFALAVALVLVGSAFAVGQSGDVRVSTDVSARQVYVGERVTLTYSLVRQVPGAEEDALVTPVREVHLVEAPRFPDFWVNELETEDANQSGGPPTTGSVPLRQFRLFPLVSGRLAIDPPAYSMLVYPTTLDVDPMPGAVTKRADPVRIDVLPLPDAGKPKTFGGAVGRFALTASLEHPSGRVGDVSRVRVVILGDGNLEATGPPRLDGVTVDRVFPARRVSVDLGLGDPNGQATAMWLLDVVPGRAGTIALGRVVLDYFDPTLARYLVAESQPLEISVSPPAPAVASPTREMATDWWRWSLIVGGLVVAGFVPLVLRRRRRRPASARDRQNDLAATQTADAAAVARLRARLAHTVGDAEAAFDAHDSRTLHARLLEGLSDVLGTMYGLGASDLTRERVEATLAGRGVPPPVVSRVARLYDHCVTAGFAPVEREPSRDTIEAAARLFDALVRRRPA